MYSLCFLLFSGSIDIMRSRFSLHEPATASTTTTAADTLLIFKRKPATETCDVGTQTDARSFTKALKEGVSSLLLHMSLSLLFFNEKNWSYCNHCCIFLVDVNSCLYTKPVAHGKKELV